jgi:hypothetical protein
MIIIGVNGDNDFFYFSCLAKRGDNQYLNVDY